MNAYFYVRKSLTHVRKWMKLKTSLKWICTAGNSCVKMYRGAAGMNHRKSTKYSMWLKIIHKTQVCDCLNCSLQGLKCDVDPLKTVTCLKAVESKRFLENTFRQGMFLNFTMKSMSFKNWSRLYILHWGMVILKLCGN